MLHCTSACFAKASNRLSKPCHNCPSRRKWSFGADMRRQDDGSARLGRLRLDTLQDHPHGAKEQLPSIVGPDGIYDMDRILAAMPVIPAIEQADVFLSYSNKDGRKSKSSRTILKPSAYTVWYDRRLDGRAAVSRCAATAHRDNQSRRRALDRKLGWIEVGDRRGGLRTRTTSSSACAIRSSKQSASRCLSRQTITSSQPATCRPY